MNVTRIGLDLAKNVFQVHGVDRSERVVVRRQLSRSQMVGFFEKLPPCLIGMEACASAHHWARTLQPMGHTVRLIAPQFVKPYIKSQKNDANDAEGICEAVGRPNMRFVTIKTREQQDMQAIHRIRSELVCQRTAKANQIRGLLGEYGIVVAKRVEQLRRALPLICEDLCNGLSGSFRRLLEDLRQDLCWLNGRIEELDGEIEQFVRQDERAVRLQTIPGIGPVTATALVADLGDARQFRRGREVSAFLGLTPRQMSSGGKERLLGISKRGDAYLRTLLIHGARSALRVAARKGDPRSRWAINVGGRRHKNIAAVALANKNARIAWALLTRGGRYDSQHGYPVQQPEAA
jgi:transposase